MKEALIVGGGPLAIAQLQQELALHPELVIAADRGGLAFLDLGELPHVLVGDFDSLPAKALAQLEALGVEVLRFPPRKNFTDLELALDLAIKRKADRIRILGGLGARIDHTFSNVGLLLKALDHHIEAHLLDQSHDLMVTKKRAVIRRKAGWAVSLVPLTLKVSGVTTSGLAYPLKQATLLFNSSRGIHNQLVDEEASIQLTAGVLLIICFQE